MSSVGYTLAITVRGFKFPSAPLRSVKVTVLPVAGFRLKVYDYLA